MKTSLKILKTSRWTPEKDARLKALYKTDHGVVSIAKMLGKSFTKGMVVSRARWLGLRKKKAAAPCRLVRQARNINKKKSKSVAGKKAVQRKRKSDGFIATFEGGGASLLHAGQDQCRWPLGDASKNDFRCCGDKVVDEKPYCLRHCRAAYQDFKTAKRSLSGDP